MKTSALHLRTTKEKPFCLGQKGFSLFYGRRPGNRALPLRPIGVAFRMFSRHGFQSPPLLHQSGRLPSHSSLVFIISARFPRARTRQVFFDFLPSPLHLSGTTY